jgi:phenylacetate-CoA ligase
MGPGKQGTPVDALVAKRIGLLVADTAQEPSGFGWNPSDLTQEKIEAFQIERFRNALSYVKENSNYYREHLQGIDSDAIRTMEDIKKIPYTTEQDLAGNEWRFQCVKASDVSRAVTIPTTGTRGKQKRLVYTMADQQKAIEFIHAGYLTMECKKGERMLIFMSGNLPGSIGDLVRQAVEPLGMEISVFGAVTDVRAAYERLLEFKPEIVEAIPWHAAALAAYGQQYGNPEKAFIRSVNLSADIVPDMVAERLRRLWGCTVHRHYGSTEMCIFGGVECIHQDGYHLRHSDILYEIPEPNETGQGEIVITTFAHEAMPLIRYKTGDIGRFVDTVCGCGANVRRLEKVWGRDSSMLRVGKEREKDGKSLQDGNAAFFLTELADAVYADDAVMDFDVEIVVDERKSDEKTETDGRLTVTVRTLPGVEADLELIRQEFYEIPGVKHAGDQIDIVWVQETFEAFPAGYNLKKKIGYAEG